MRKPELPIYELEQPLLETLTTQKQLVVTAPTGSAKSTRVSQKLLDGGSGVRYNTHISLLPSRSLVLAANRDNIPKGNYCAWAKVSV